LGVLWVVWLEKIIEKYPHLKAHGYHMNDFGQLWLQHQRTILGIRLWTFG
jgi:hypothetical protein